VLGIICFLLLLGRIEQIQEPQIGVEAGLAAGKS
jgi:hypothetical protein